MVLSRLPPEIRLRVYELYFDDVVLSTISTHKQKADNPVSTESGQSFPRFQRNCPLSLLLVCRTIYNESRGIWLSHVTFKFDRMSQFVLYMMRLPQSLITKIRRVRICHAYPLCSAPQGMDQASVSSFRGLTFMPPGLQLDELVLGDPWHGEIWSNGIYETPEHSAQDAYYFVQQTLQATSGWKECRIVSGTTELLDWSTIPDRPYAIRQVQPENWRNMMLERDGVESGANVSIIMRPDLLGEQDLISDDHYDFTHRETRNQMTKPNTPCTMITIRRGRGAHYEQTYISQNKTVNLGGAQVFTPPRMCYGWTRSVRMSSFLESLEECEDWAGSTYSLADLLKSYLQLYHPIRITMGR